MPIAHALELHGQARLLLAALESGRRMTAMDIIKELNILMPWPRIHELRNKGAAIVTEMIPGPNGREIALYSLAEAA